jgi:hypothetical protein
VSLLLVGASQTHGSATLEFEEGGLGGDQLGDLRGTGGADGYAGTRLVIPVVDPEGDCPYGQATLLGNLFGAGSSFCIDRYESSRNTSLPELLRNELTISQPLSLPEELPWVDVSYDEALSACGRNGGYLCPDYGIVAACTFGPAVDADDCNFDEELERTGTYPLCVTTNSQLADLLGNAAEWVFETEPWGGGRLLSGGSYLYEGEELACGDVLEVSSVAGRPDIGFRCCYITAHFSDTEAR